jgi:hypothetical protein
MVETKRSADGRRGLEKKVSGLAFSTSEPASMNQIQSPTERAKFAARLDVVERACLHRGPG